MMNHSASTSSGSKRALIIAGSVIVALAVVYFSFFYPPVSTSDTEGTIGAVKKYRAEQITEKDIVLDAMASMNIETVSQAVDRTSTKIAESAREAVKIAEEMWASGRNPEAQKIIDGLKNMALKSEALREGKLKGPEALKGGEALRGEAMKGEALKGEALKGEAMKGEALKGEAMKGEALKGEAMKGEAAKYYEAAAIASEAKTWGAKIEGMTAAARTQEAMKIGENLKNVEEAAAHFSELGVRVELLKLADAARGIAVRAEQMRTDGKAAEEWARLASEARTLGQKADALKEFARPEQVRSFVDGVQIFAARADVSGMRPDAMKEALDAARNMAGRASELARPNIGEGRDSRAE